MIVQKYGGMTLSTPESIKAVAASIAKLKSDGHDLIIVVSAMGKTTDALQNLALKVSQNPNRREFDMLLSTGERVSAALLSIALNDLNCPSISFTGSQAGIMTNPSHTDAKIVAVKPIRVEEELKKGRVIVLAGFQGVCPETKEITTLGRGGSDTTAVAMANHFHAERCEILKDVDGVYSGDPKIVENPVHIDAINHQQLFEMTFWGGKFLHYRSSELARDLKTSLVIDSAHGLRKGTRIGTHEKSSGGFLAINQLKKIGCLKLNSDSKQSSAFHNLSDENPINEELFAHDLPTIRLLAKVDSADTIYFAYDSLASCDYLKKIAQVQTGLAALTMTFAQPVDQSLVANLFSAIGKTPSEQGHFIQSQFSATFFVQQDDCEATYIKLHERFANQG